MRESQELRGACERNPISISCFGSERLDRTVASAQEKPQKTGDHRPFLGRCCDLDFFPTLAPLRRMKKAIVVEWKLDDKTYK